MLRLPETLFVLSAVAGFALLADDALLCAQNKTAPAPAVQTVQDAKGEAMAKAVDLVTVDKVELKGKFYPSKKLREAACVILLHELGDNSTGKEWINFAKKLQEKGFAVLTFDFRGHGDSTTVQPGTVNKNPMLSIKGFWDEMLNQQGVKGYVASKPRPTEIKYEKFTAAYQTVLVNDIAAAKAFLDERNDAGECNSSNVILIGAKDGATLGALWLNSEWHRYKYLQPQPGLPKGALDRENPEGAAVTAAVWLSMTSTIGNSKAYNVSQMLEIPGKHRKVPMVFVYGEGEDKASTLATQCEKFLKGNNTKDYPWTGAKAIKNAKKMSGVGLLVENLDTTDMVLGFLEDALPKKTPAVKIRAKIDDSYMWEWTTKAGQLQQSVAKKKGAASVEFSGYATFLK